MLAWQIWLQLRAPVTHRRRKNAPDCCATKICCPKCLCTSAWTPPWVRQESINTCMSTTLTLIQLSTRRSCPSNAPAVLASFGAAARSAADTCFQSTRCKCKSVLHMSAGLQHDGAAHVRIQHRTIGTSAKSADMAPRLAAVPFALTLTRPARMVSAKNPAACTHTCSSTLHMCTCAVSKGDAD